MRLNIHNLAVQFGSSTTPYTVLKNLTFVVGEGEFLTILGPSGCGKTTLLHALAGLLKPAQGHVERIAASADGSHQARLVFQENSLFPWMTALENAAFGLEMAGVAKPDREALALAQLTRYGLADFAHAYPSRLSVGMKQRVAVIRAFLASPALLLMDEPFGAVDSQTRYRLQCELLNLWEEQRTTVVFVTHDVEEAILLSDRILVFNGRPAEIVAERPVGLPRRGRAALAGTPEFQALRSQLGSQLARDLGLPAWDLQHA